MEQGWLRVRDHKIFLFLVQGPSPLAEDPSNMWKMIWRCKTGQGTPYKWSYIRQKTKNLIFWRKSTNFGIFDTKKVAECPTWNLQILFRMLERAPAKGHRPWIKSKEILWSRKRGRIGFFLVWAYPPGFLFAETIPHKISTALHPPSFSPVFSALKTGKKEKRKQKVSLEPHQAEKGLLVWFQWA